MTFNDYLFFYGSALFLMVLVIFCWVLSWRSLLRSLNVKVGLKSAFLFYWSGFFIDLVVPCQQICGEVSRIYLVHKKTHENYGIVGAAGIVNRTVGYSIVFVALTTSTIYLIIISKVPSFALNILA